jgi:hypothetical protein
MRKPALITTPYPTTDETARKLGISKRRQKEIEKLALELHLKFKAERSAKRKGSKSGSAKKRGSNGRKPSVS